MPERIRFHINLSNEEFLRHYSGRAQAVIVLAEDGRRVRLPARNFRNFITKEGIQGRFEVELDDNNRLIKMTKIG